MKLLQEQTGVKMVIIQDAHCLREQTCLFASRRSVQVQQAREIVSRSSEKKTKLTLEVYAVTSHPEQEEAAIGVSVPRFAVGIVLGRNGEMIKKKKKIQNDAGVSIQFKPDAGFSPERAAKTLVGAPTDVSTQRTLSRRLFLKPSKEMALRLCSNQTTRPWPWPWPLELGNRCCQPGDNIHSASRSVWPSHRHRG